MEGQGTPEPPRPLPEPRPDTSAPARTFGNRTLARGLDALIAVAAAPDGMTVQQLAAVLGVHRSIAYRVVQTLLDVGLVRTDDERTYRPGSRLATMGAGGSSGLRAAALPPMRRLCDRLGASVVLVVVQGDSAVAVDLVRPTTPGPHLALRQGRRTPLDAGPTADALRSADAPRDGEPVGVQQARELGWAAGAGADGNGVHEVAAVVPGTVPRACLTVVTHLAERARGAGPAVAAAAREVADRLR
ncbi:helix-turn-helix domain-containing protein [Blastococcus sp. URHD0036]|uniref:helix-turn-helix domain-containing protein n=1 Tax=Blastococcus sp. URHD0036 TaxID=1380356 RepID=UPI000494E40F|nr:helix-turn-helix domain-containing protein [Blastococcus sp. URHD0036]